MDFQKNKRRISDTAKTLIYNTVCKWWIELFGKRDDRKLKYFDLYG